MAEVKDPKLVEAEIREIESNILKNTQEAKFFEIQAIKEGHIAVQHELAAEEARRVASAMRATNSENRTYDFIGNVSTGTVENCMQTLSRWRRQSKEPVIIRISSPGGSLIDGLALFDYIQSLRADGIHVTTNVLGMAASMAGILLQAGDKRVVGPNAHVLIHEASSGASGKLSELEDETKFIKRLNDRTFEILASRSSMKKATIELRAKRKDWWLAAEEVLQHKFADEIGYV